MNLVYSGPNFLVQELQYYQALMNPPVNTTTPKPSMQPTSRPSNASMWAPPPVNGASWAWNVTSTVAITDVLMSFLGSYSAGEQWHGYYDQDLPAQLKGGWYKDPLCGDRCTLQSNVTLGKRAHVYVGTNCSQWLGPINHKLVATSKNKTTCGAFTVNFLSPLIMRDRSSFRVGDTAQVVLFSGGWCQSNASFNTSVRCHTVLHCTATYLHPVPPSTTYTYPHPTPPSPPHMLHLTLSHTYSLSTRQTLTFVCLVGQRVAGAGRRSDEDDGGMQGVGPSELEPRGRNPPPLLITSTPHQHSSLSQTPLSSSRLLPNNSILSQQRKKPLSDPIYCINLR